MAIRDFGFEHRPGAGNCIATSMHLGGRSVSAVACALLTFAASAPSSVS